MQERWSACASFLVAINENKASVQIHILKEGLGFSKFVDKGHENAKLILSNIFLLLQISVDIS